MTRRMTDAPQPVAAAVAVTPIDPADSGSFGIIDVHPTHPDRMRRLRQRPEPDTVTDPLAVVSRLVLRPSIFDNLAPPRTPLVRSTSASPSENSPRPAPSPCTASTASGSPSETRGATSTP